MPSLDCSSSFRVASTGFVPIMVDALVRYEGITQMQ